MVGFSITFIILFGIIPFLIGILIFYLVVKAAVREGIRESGLIEATRMKAIALSKPNDVPDWIPD